LNWSRTCRISGSPACRAKEARHHLLVEELGRLSAESGLDCTMSPGFKDKYLCGAGELELVRSGPDDRMRGACQAMREVWHGRNNMRVAVDFVAISRVAGAYQSKGL
jgi:glutamate dehydrogenase (NAD(P)+)